jgi:hypothetical protein
LALRMGDVRQRLRQTTQEFNQLFFPIAIEPSELEELSGPLDDRSSFWRTRNRDAPPSLELQQSLVAQHPQRSEHGVGIDAQHGGEVLGRREALSAMRLPCGDGTPDLGRHLIVQGHALGAVDLDRQHDASNSSTMATQVHDPTTTPAEDLIPEARQHQHRRYHRTGVLAALGALLVAALIASGLVLISGPAASDRSHSVTAPALSATSPAPVFFRPVLCYAAPFDALAHSSVPSTALSCTPSSALSTSNLNVQPQGADVGFSSNTVSPDGTLAGVPSTKPSADKATSTVLLPGLPGAEPYVTNGGRFVLGPAEMTSASIGSAVAQRTRTGQWAVDYTMLGSRGAALWDHVAQENFHLVLGIDFRGLVVSAPIIQPTQSSFTSFDGRGEIGGNLNKAEATALARAMNNRH